jgi:hypothetical protein
VSVIHGPPGTGKTLVKAAIVCFFVLAYADKQYKIMLTAPSNIATYHLCLVVQSMLNKLKSYLPENYLNNCVVRIFPNLIEPHFNDIYPCQYTKQ